MKVAVFVPKLDLIKHFFDVPKERNGTGTKVLYDTPEIIKQVWAFL